MKPPLNIYELSEIKRKTTHRKQTQHDQGNAYDPLLNWGGVKIIHVASLRNSSDGGI